MLLAGQKVVTISIHAPLTGSDCRYAAKIVALQQISIHAPLTGSDSKKDTLLSVTSHFNPRSPYGERLSGFISSAVWALFQSTLPLRGATRVDRYKYRRHLISIHAPLTGSDLSRISCSVPRLDFNPRSPYGERPTRQRDYHLHRNFNPRSPYGERPRCWLLCVVSA